MSPIALTSFQLTTLFTSLFSVHDTHTGNCRNCTYASDLMIERSCMIIVIFKTHAIAIHFYLTSDVIDRRML